MKLIVLILITASSLTAMGGFLVAAVLECVWGWDVGVYNAGVFSFLLGFLALMMTAGLDSMVSSREDREHRLEMDAIYKARGN